MNGTFRTHTLTLWSQSQAPIDYIAELHKPQIYHGSGSSDDGERCSCVRARIFPRPTFLHSNMSYFETITQFIKNARKVPSQFLPSLMNELIQLISKYLNLQSISIKHNISTKFSLKLHVWRKRKLFLLLW